MYARLLLLDHFLDSLQRIFVLLQNGVELGRVDEVGDAGLAIAANFSGDDLRGQDGVEAVVKATVKEACRQCVVVVVRGTDGGDWAARSTLGGWFGGPVVAQTHWKDGNRWSLQQP